MARANFGFGVPLVPDPAMMAMGEQPERPAGNDFANNASSFLSAIGMALMSSPRNSPLSNLPNILPGLIQAQQKRDRDRQVLGLIQGLNRNGPPMPGMDMGGGDMAAPMPMAAPGVVGNAGSAGNVSPVSGAVAPAAPEQYASLIQSAASANNIDPATLTKLISTESGFRPDAVSPAGARGIAQFMPGTAQRFGIDPLKPEQAIPAAAQYVAQNRDMFGGNIGLALAGYNWGEGNVKKWLDSGASPSRVPAETRNYVQAITGKPIESWLSDGGTGNAAASAPVQYAQAGPATMTDAMQAGAPATNLRTDFNGLARNGMLPPGVGVNSAGLPYSASMTALPQQQSANAESSMAALRNGGFGEAASDTPAAGSVVQTAPAPPDTVVTPRQAVAQASSKGAFADVPRSQLAQAQSAMPSRPEPRNPETVAGPRSQAAAAQRYFDHYAKVMSAAALLGEDGKGLMEAAKLRAQFAMKFMEPTEIQRNVAAAFPGNLSAQQQALRNSLTDNSPEHAGAVTAAQEQAKLGPDLYKQQFGTDEAIRREKGTPTTETKDYEAYVADTQSRGQTPLSMFEWGQQRRRAQNQNEFGSIPPGYQIIRGADGSVSMVPILGSPTEQKAKLEQQQRRQTANIVVQEVNRAEALIKDATLPTTGAGGALLQRLPGTASHDLSNLLNTIKGNSSFDKLQQMRAASPTGGALGPVSDFENKMLQSTLGALEQSQTKDQFLFNLRRYRDIYMDIIDGPDGPHRAAMRGPTQAGVAAPGAAAPIQTPFGTIRQVQ